jgi:hypothetical protein
MSTMSIDEFQDPVLDEALAHLPLQPSLPTAAARAVIHSAARQAVGNTTVHSRRWLPFVVGGLVAAALAGAMGLTWRSSHHVAEPNAAGPVVTRPVAAGVVEAAAIPEAPAAAASARKPSVAPATRVAELRLLPPRAQSSDYARDALNATWQSLLDSNDEGHYLVGLLFDDHGKLIRTAGPAPMPPPPADPEHPDPALYSGPGIGRRLFGLVPRDVSKESASIQPAPPVPGHPVLYSWAYTLRPESERISDAQVRAATAAYFNGKLPPHDATANIPLVTAVMDAQGRFDRSSIEYRAPQVNGPFLESAFDADSAARLAALGLQPADTGRSGTMMVGSEDLPGGEPGGFAVVTYAWPKTLRPAEPTPASSVASDVDHVAAVQVLRSQFSPQQLLDTSDGRHAWVLLDHFGRVLVSGRSSGEARRPPVVELMEHHPELRIESSLSTAIEDAANRGVRYEAEFLWLSADSPAPR